MKKKSLLLLNRIKSVSSKVDNIISYFGGLKEFLGAKRRDLESSSLFNKKEIETIIQLKDSQEIEEEMERIEKEGIELVSIFDKDYPPLLKEIASAPLLLYVKGKKEVLRKMCFAIVGTRVPTLYWLNIAERFAFGLASLGFVVVSGFARGIDTASHKAVLKVGETIAVLGSGLLNLYPKENKELAEKVIEKGALVSEFPLFMPPLRENFPRRNRIISGLSKGVLVVEAHTRSGALITARYALEQNREVFAIPGQVGSPLSKGTHSLIKEGAKLVDSLQDILEELNINFEPQMPSFNLSDEEKIILDIIGNKGMFLEELIFKCGLKREVVTRNVLSLQIKGLVKEMRPLYFTRTM